MNEDKAKRIAERLKQRRKKARFHVAPERVESVEDREEYKPKSKKEAMNEAMKQYRARMKGMDPKELRKALLDAVRTYEKIMGMGKHE